MESTRKAHGSATLIALMGMSPGVVTESLFALGQQGERVDRIEVLTTSKAVERFLGTWGDVGQPATGPAATRVLRRLLGWLDHDHPELGLDRRMSIRLHVPEVGGEPIADIATDAEAQGFLDGLAANVGHEAAAAVESCADE